MSSLGTRYIAPILLSILLSGSSCGKKCENEVCVEDQDLRIVFIDSSNQIITGANLIGSSDIHLISPSNDTLYGAVDSEKGTFNVRTNRDLGLYTMSIQNEENVDLAVYQSYAASEFECCPGYWRIDSVYARGEALAPLPSKGGFYFKLE